MGKIINEPDFIRFAKDLCQLDSNSVTIPKSDFLVLIELAELVTSKMKPNCANFDECKVKREYPYCDCVFFIDKKEVEERRTQETLDTEDKHSRKVEL